MNTIQEQTVGATHFATMGDTQIRIEREFHGPRELVYELMTDPALVVEWYGKRAHDTTVEEMDVRVGGRYCFASHTEDGATHRFSGEFRELAPSERIVQTWEWDGMPGHVSVEALELYEVDATTTRMVLVSTFDSQADRDGLWASGMTEGANETYERLDALVQRRAGA
jgi:uncharacterized protein YndB with AHSA1/START domain